MITLPTFFSINKRYVGLNGHLMNNNLLQEVMIISSMFGQFITPLNQWVNLIVT
jgi:hypothetical protein